MGFNQNAVFRGFKFLPFILRQGALFIRPTVTLTFWLTLQALRNPVSEEIFHSGVGREHKQIRERENMPGGRRMEVRGPGRGLTWWINRPHAA